MTNIRWPLSHSGNFKFNEARNEVFEKKALKTDTIYNVVILNIDDIKKSAHFIQDETNNLIWQKLLKKGMIKKNPLGTAIIEMEKLEIYKIYFEMYTQNEVKNKLPHKVINRNEESIIKRYKDISDAILKEYINGNVHFKNNKYSTDVGRYLEKDIFPYYTHQSVNALVLKVFFDEWQNNDLKEKISSLVKYLAEIEENNTSVIHQQYISKAAMSGYLRDVHYLSIDSVTKPFVSLIEEKKYQDGLLEKMNNQASSIEIFNLNNPRCVERFLKIFDFD